MPCHSLQRSGFSLIEVAIVLLVMGLLAGGLVMPLSAQMERVRVGDTRRAMDDIREALLGFAVANGRLPCPANGAVATGTAGAGTELLVGNNCTAIRGVLPWATLGLPETDAWGRRYTYRVTTTFGDAIAANTVAPPVTCVSIPAQASFALCSQGDMTINTRAPNKALGALATQISAVVLSHGKNGYGAFQNTGTAVGAPPAANIDETTNANVALTTFVSRDITDQGTPCNDAAGANKFCEFDDLVLWISPNVLASRMVMAGRLP